MLYTRDGQLIDQGPGGVHEAVLYGFWETIRLTKLRTFVGLKCPCSGNKVSLKRAKHPTLLQVLRRCPKGTCRAAKGDAAGSKHPPSCVFASAVLFHTDTALGPSCLVSISS